MTSFVKCLENFLKAVKWSSKDLKENEYKIEFSKRISDISEIECLLKHDYQEIFNTLRTAFNITLSNDKSLQRPISIKNGFNLDNIKEYIKDVFEPFGYVNVKFTLDKIDFYSNHSELSISIQECNFYPFLYSCNLLEWLSSFNISELEKEVFKDGKQTIFLALDLQNTVSNKFTMLAGNNVTSELIDTFTKEYSTREHELLMKWRFKQVNWLEGTKWISPDHFFMDFESIKGEKLLKSYFLKNAVNLIISFISNYIYTENNETLCIINGNKRIPIRLLDEESYNQNEVEYLFEIYKWAYTGYNSDKLSILRNLITIIICEDCGVNSYKLLLSKSKEIYKTVVNNFEMYLKENVEQYFNVRQKILDLIQNESNEISNQIGNTVNNLNRNLLTFLGTVFTFIIGFVQNTNINLLFFLLIAFISYVVIYSVYYLSFSKIKIKYIKDYSKKDIERLRKNIFDSDLPKFEDTQIYEYIKTFNKFWYSSIVVNAVLIVITILAFIHLNVIIEAFSIIEIPK